jgi:hypothetical protein
VSSDPLAKEQLRRYEDQKAARSSVFDPAWQRLSNYFLPQTSDIQTQKTEGTENWTDRIYDTTAIQAAQVLKSGQRNWLTPSNEPWFTFDPPEHLRGEGDGDEASQWFGRATDIALKEFERSGFYAAVNMDYLAVGVFGTGCIFCDEGKTSALNFRSFKIATYTIGENDEGIVDEVRREFELTTRQACQMFTLEKLPASIQKAYESSRGQDKKWKFVHCIFPREDSERMPRKSDGANKPIASVYIEKESQKVVRVSGYDEMPAMVSRFDKWGTDSPWGYSPAFLCLPEARQLNFISQYVDALAELKAYPRVLIPSNLDGDVDLRAGGPTVFDETMGEGGMPREWASVGDYQLAIDLMNRKSEAINRAFFVNIFQMLEQLADKKMTAFEIAQRQSERLEQFTSTFDRRVTEFLNPLLRRVFGMLYRQGRFGPAPSSLLVQTGHNSVGLAMPEINITSRISLALKALRNTGIVNTLSVVTPLAEQKPEVLDNFDLDFTVRDISRNYGSPPDLLRPMKKVMEIRQQRAKMQQAQQALELAQGAAKAGKDLGKAPEAMQEQMQGALGAA